MNNNLPNIYRGIINDDNNMDNNTIKRCYDKEPMPNINSKINSIFKSNNFVYKKTAKVDLKDGSSKVVTIVGRNYNYLITLDHGNINIDDILNITI